MNFWTNLEDLQNLEDLEIIESSKENALLNSVINPNSLISFPINMNFETNNIAAFQISGDKKFIDIPLTGLGEVDIISDIYTMNVSRMELLLNDQVVTMPDRLIKCAIPYVEIKLRLFFNKDQIPTKFSIHYIGYMISNHDLRRKIISNRFIDCELKYSDGIIIN